MVDITNILFWISTGLLIPVVVLLLVLFIRALMMTGNFVGLYINRLKFQKELESELAIIKKNPVSDLKFLEKIKGNSAFTDSLKSILSAPQKLYAEKELLDFELQCDKDLAKAKSTTRLGPMLGLMGTLIPMGPALVGLAAGDIASMAQNMQVAFSTTVVGLFAGALGYVLQLVKHRWYVEDLNNLEFIFNLQFPSENTMVKTTKNQTYVEEEELIEQ